MNSSEFKKISKNLNELLTHHEDMSCGKIGLRLSPLNGALIVSNETLSEFIEEKNSEVFEAINQLIKIEARSLIEQIEEFLKEEEGREKKKHLCVKDNCLKVRKRRSYFCASHHTNRFHHVEEDDDALLFGKDERRFSDINKTEE